VSRRAARRPAGAVSFGRDVGGWLAIGLGWALGLGATGRAWAQEAVTQVTVLRPSGADVALAEIATRAWAELNAGGVPARLLDCPVAPAPCPVEAPAQGRNAISLRTFRLADETITEAALTPAGRDRPTVRRSLTVDDQAEADPKVMAIRAVELVNAMLLQVDAASAEGASGIRRGVDPEDPGQHWKPEKAVVEHPAIWTVGAGGSLLKGPGGLSAAAGFAIRVSRWGEGDVPFGVSAMVTEAPSLARTSTVDGSMILNQQLADIQLMWRVFRRRRFRSQVGVGGGAYHVDANWTGVPVQALGGRAVGMQDRWALLLSGGAGAELDLGLKMSVFGEVRAELASPTPQVYGATGLALRTADPSLLLALGLQRAF
jgi:hypothetical protein